MAYCCSRQQLKQLIEYKFAGKEIDCDKFGQLVNLAEDYQDELHGLSYLVSIIIEKYIKKGVNHIEPLNTFYELENMMFFGIQECDRNFISYLMINNKDHSLSLEESLINIQNSYCEHDYESCLRV